MVGGLGWAVWWGEWADGQGALLGERLRMGAGRVRSCKAAFWVYTVDV